MYRAHPENRPAKLEGCSNTAIYMRTAAAGREVANTGHRLLTGHCTLYGHRMLTIATQLDVMNRLGRAMADPTRSRILLSLLDRPSYPAALADELSLSRTNVSNHLSCLRGCGIVVATPEGRRTRYEIADGHLSRALSALVETVLAVDDGAPCTDSDCDVPLCCHSPIPAAEEIAR